MNLSFRKHLTKREVLLLVLVLVFTTSLLGWEMLRSREPVYNGKTVTQWMRSLRVEEDSQEFHDATNAMNQLGTNVIPYALKYIATKDWRLERMIVKSELPGKVARFLGLGLRYSEWADSFVDRPPIGFIAFKAIGKSGVPAISDLIHILRTSRSPYERVIASDLLQNLGTNAQGALPELMESFADADLEVRVTASIVVGVIRQGSSAEDFRNVDWTNRLPYTKRSVDLILPVFLKLLTERRVTDDRLIAALAGFPLNDGVAATPGLLKLLEHPDAMVRHRATNALERINPSVLRLP
jgi:hypothetical protein